MEDFIKSIALLVLTAGSSKNIASEPEFLLDDFASIRTNHRVELSLPFFWIKTSIREGDTFWLVLMPKLHEKIF